MSRSRVHTTALLLLLPLGGVAVAGEWELRTTPYGWLTSITGAVTVRGHDVKVDADFSDTVAELDSLVALMAYTEARKDAWGFYLDGAYLEVGFTASSSEQRNPIPGLTLSRDTDTGLSTELALIEGGILYEVGRWGGADGAYSAVDVLAGARYMYSSVDLSLEITGTVDLPALGFEREGELAVARSRGADWVDPIAGVRYRYHFPHGDRIVLRGDIGGFGVGSDFSWQLLGTYSWDFAWGDSTWSAVLGYRVLDVDFSEGEGLHENGINLMLHGPVVGLTFRW